ncbi:ASKHA domain-containing protein [Desulfosporosinus sp. PR]|uniref:ASKHA domain-containing protein n=1 Tax=Candidatus Desulfosporosinus nitrosoreducens TaxID=3401928 RepID=UPI0027F78B89|nr:ASKHA domain-containing protein [Desulfosporosinus sp. PR]MDQ7097050.1 ASKHA domain-containing protein [Desulfosporosinus sp. PR]
MNCEICFLPMKVRVVVPAGTTVLEGARKVGLPLASLCTGNGACGKCRIIPDRKAEGLNQLTLAEKLSLGAELTARGYRLACLTQVSCDVAIEIPAASLRAWVPLAKEAAKVLDLSSYPPRRDYKEAKQAWGIAVDLGTTTLAGYLHDLKSQSLERSAAVPNPQTLYGADILTRANYGVNSPEGAKELRAALFQGLNELLITLLQGSAGLRRDVERIVLVGNAFMHHSFLGLDLLSLSQYPFAPLFTEGVSLRVADLGGEVPLLLEPATLVEVLPLVGGFVGSDLLAGLLATGVIHSPDSFLYVDLGTNSEVALGNKERILVTSTSAGPAFEGGAMECGMQAQPGAIDEVDLASPDLTVRTIHNLPPLGLCGSGAISLLAELLKKGIVDGRGHLLRPNGLIKEQAAYVLDLPNEKKIGLTARDIGELQKAKAAVYAAAAVLAAEFGIPLHKISRVYVAGAFGTYLPLDQAMSIGLLPNYHPEAIIPAGNAAGDGARMVLVSEELRQELGQVLSKVELLNMGVHPSFMAEFIKALFFPHEDLLWFES